VANAGDCNDGNAAINPGAAEICNAVDDNCDGHIDEGCPSVTYYYLDADNDGYGDPDDWVTESTPGFIETDGDCDDGDDQVHPGATEQCDGVDNDCDGATDEGCVTYYEDADGDVFGNPSSTKIVNSPSPPPGYVANWGDCNDNNVNVHPGVPEICTNRVDDNCDGNVDESCPAYRSVGYGGISVGGIVLPVNKLGLMAPWIALMALMIGVIIWWAVIRRQKQGCRRS
jgi:hypothetical protein